MVNIDSGWIQTFTCKKFYIENPKLEDICIEDIAHALSMICRFTGHTKEFYSVGTHSLYVSKMCSKENQLYGLLHDATEAYIQDLNRSVKQMDQLAGYREIEHNLHKTICNKFGLQEIEPAEVKAVDTKMLATEALQFMSPLHKDWSKQGINAFDIVIEAASPKTAEHLFLARFYELTDGK
jgi:uncharacterized protein